MHIREIIRELKTIRDMTDRTLNAVIDNVDHHAETISKNSVADIKARVDALHKQLS
jgi:polyhydroxyalkanoate synthesis regulator phasin